MVNRSDDPSHHERTGVCERPLQYLLPDTVDSSGRLLQRAKRKELIY